jgi:hypothetical protein
MLPSSPETLTRAQANEVLRYWLASVQQEEALSTRPRARRPPSALLAPRLDSPSPGHDYFKLQLDDALAALLCAESVLRKPFDPELGAFFEHWLAQSYRRGDQDRELTHLLAFPVVHLPRGELAGLLRCGLQVEFSDDVGSAFEVPSRSARRRKQYPAAPSQVRLAAAARGNRQWPFFLDTRLLQQQLGVARESIDELFAVLTEAPEISAPQMLRMVCELLEAELVTLERGSAPREVAPDDATSVREEEAPPASVIARITSAMSRLLARRGGPSRVYPVAIVFDSTRAKTTWYLQRELQALLEERSEVAWDLDSSLGAYLTGRRRPASSAIHRALFASPALAESQRLAAERCGGSVLTAVQGPPGTGKTTLILHLAAEALVRQVDALADGGEMGDGAMVVASTNNRAVDNVVDPLLAASKTGLPLALRAGSRKVCEQILAPQLEQARAWLERSRQRTAAERAAELELALSRFRSIRAEVEAVQAARARVLKAAAERSSWQLELAQLESSEPGSTSPLDPAQAKLLRAPLTAADKRLRRLAELCEATAGLIQLSAVDRAYRAAAKRDLPALFEAAAISGERLELGLPPALPPSVDPAVLMASWQDAVEVALTALGAFQERVDAALGAARRQERLNILRRQLAQSSSPPMAADVPALDESLARALFERAVEAREAWAALHAAELLTTVTSAVSAARSEFSLRPIWSDDRAEWQRLRRLFGLWGCTLLSLGNCFPAQRDGLERLIIDEAGQCHPAYAISGLLRARTALIIGDVHQLEPVIDLERGDDERVIESCKLSLSKSLLAPYRVHNEARCSVQALADRAVSDPPQLVDHFRCQPEIIAICDALCSYGLRVHTAPQGPAVPLRFLPSPVSLLDVAGEQQRLGGSWHNPAELALTLELFHALIGAGIQPDDVAIITPYRGQLEQLRREFVRLGLPFDRSLEFADDDAPAAEGGVALGTVHRFQGGERSIVLFTSVVTRSASLGFLDDRENLLNVAVSRARHRFVAIGKRALLAAGQRTRLLTRAAQPLSAAEFRSQLGLQL